MFDENKNQSSKISRDYRFKEAPSSKGIWEGKMYVSWKLHMVRDYGRGTAPDMAFSVIFIQEDVPLVSKKYFFNRCIFLQSGIFE